MSAQPTLDVVIVNWNSGPDLRACLGALAAASQAQCALQRVVVVDNGSADGSAEGLAAGSLPLRVIRNPANRGFAAACNQGARDSAADFVLFLNPDVWVEPGALDATLLAVGAAGRERIGVCGIQLLNDAGRIWRSCSRFPQSRHFALKALWLDRILPAAFSRPDMREWDHAQDRDVDQVIGAFFLVRRVVLEALGGFDERFFVYFEEVDMCLRAWRAGWRTWYFTGARARHRGGGASAQDRAGRLRLVLGSRIAYARKHFGLTRAGLVLAITLGVEPLSRLVQAVAGSSSMRPREIVAAYAGLWRDLRADRTRRRPGP